MPKRGKFISKNQITGQSAINLIERIVLEMGYTWVPTSGATDAGIDGIIEIRDPATGEARNFILQVQSKSTTVEFESETKSSFIYRVKERDLGYWLQGNAPVLLIVCRPSQNEAYWIPVKTYFNTPEVRRSCKVLFDKQKNAFDKNAARAVADLAMPADQGVYLHPPPKPETLTTNLLEVKHYAPDLFVGVTPYKTNKEVESVFKELEERPGRVWFVKEGKIFSFHNLSEYPWSKVTDQGTIEKFHAKEWALSNDPDKQHEFVRLLNQSLRTFARRKDIVTFDQKRRDPVFYFKPRIHRNAETNSEAFVERIETWTLEKSSTRTVVHIYRSFKNERKVLYFRHHAFLGHFCRFENRWFLELSPTYHYTTDGKIESPYRAENLAGMKRQEGHQSVSNNVRFLAYYLAHHDLLDREYPFLGFGDLLSFKTEFGIRDEDWKNRTDPDEVVVETVDPNAEFTFLEK
jgi:hypothetical protein